MAKKNKNEKPALSYSEAERRLREGEPGRLYLLWGPEEYLREYFLGELKKKCLPEGEDDFSFRRLNGPELDPNELRSAVDAMPFLSERSFVEVRGAELNKLKEADRILAVLEDIPDFCTVAFVQNAQFEPDGRSKLVKAMRERGEDVSFTQQSQDKLIRWIVRRFAAANKHIELEAAQRLIFISGDLMNRLIPEIDKISAYAKGQTVTVQDVETVANHIPEAVVFDLSDAMAGRKFNTAFSILSELLADKNNEPIFLLSLLGTQMRGLYAAKLADEQQLGVKGVMDLGAARYDFQARRLLTASRGFTREQLINAVRICAETDYRIKSSGGSDRELLEEALLRIAAGEEKREAD